MPRRNYRRSYRRTERKPLIWEPCQINAPLNRENDTTKPAPRAVAVGDIYKICDISLSNNADTEVILERIRGGLWWFSSTQNNPASGLNAIFYGIILPDIVAGNFLPGANLKGQMLDHGFPTPADPQGTDDFPLVMDACAPAANAFTAQNPLVVDVKSKRKMGKDELLTIAIQVLEVLPSTRNYIATIKGFVRTLQKIL